MTGVTSANTELYICNICSGDTSTSGPHPTWTDNQGNSVIQMNAFALSGPNGLYN